MSHAVRIGVWRVWLPPTGDVGRAGGTETQREPHEFTSRGDAHREAQPSGGEIQWLALADRLATTAAPCHRSKHAATYRTVVDGRDVYLKRYHRYRWRTVLKDMLRPSKARHVACVSAELAAAGFDVPRVLAVAEQRRGPVLVGAWVATAALDGVPIAERLADLARRCVAATTTEARVILAEKRRVLGALGAAVARLHARGFVAGDLVPTNVWLTRATGATDAIAFLDHDRTCAGRAPAPWRRARRNLVQLNRLVLTGVVATDRARVYRAYVAGRGWTRAGARRRLRWIVAKTIARRRRFDGVADAAALGFRRLMRAPAMAPPETPTEAGPVSAAEHGRR
jgi:tRNA A-37 threonylcarbamoyl transferase component Bud32